MNRWLLLAVLLFVSPSWALESFEATYQLLLDGEKKGDAHFSLQTDETGYSFESFTQPIQSLRQGRHEVLERSQGHFDGNRPEPDSYYFAIRTDQASEVVEIFFDWKQMRMALRSDQSRERYRLEEGTQDRLSYLLRAMALASEHGSEALFPRVSIEGSEKISLHKKLRKHLTTPAGRFLVQEITITGASGKSIRHLWLAVRKGFLPVALEHETDQGVARMELTGFTPQ